MCTEQHCDHFIVLCVSLLAVSLSFRGLLHLVFTLESNNPLTFVFEKGSFVIIYVAGNTCLFFSDKPEVKIVVTYPEGLTREGDNLDLTCIAEGKPQ